MAEEVTKIGVLTENIKRKSKSGSSYTVLTLISKNKQFDTVMFLPKFSELIDNNFITGDFIKVIGTIKQSACGGYSNFNTNKFYKIKPEQKMFTSWENVDTQEWVECKPFNPVLSDKEYVQSEQERNKEDKLAYNKEARTEYWFNLVLDEIRAYHNEELKGYTEKGPINAKNSQELIKVKSYKDTLLKRKTIMKKGVFSAEEETLIKQELRKRQNKLNKITKHYLYIYKLRNASNTHEKIKTDAETERVRRNNEIVHIHGQKYDFVTYLLNNDKTEDISIITAELESFTANIQGSNISIILNEELIQINFAEFGFFYISDNELKEKDKVLLIYKKIEDTYTGLFIAKLTE